MLVLFLVLTYFNFVFAYPHDDDDPFDDECKEQMRLPSKYVKVTQDVVDWLVYEDLKKKKRRDEVWDCLVG